MKRKILSFGIVFALVASSNLAFATEPAYIPQHYWGEKNLTTHSATIGVVSVGPETLSRMAAIYSSSGAFLYGERFTALLPVCKTSNETGCIEGLWSKKTSESNWTAATFVSYKRTDMSSSSYIYNWKADPKFGLPAPGSESTWNLSNASYGAGSTYDLAATITGFSPDNPQVNQNDSQRLDVRLSPTVNGKKYLFEKGFEFKVDIRLGASADRLWNFYNVRIQDPQITLDSKSPLHRISVSGSPLFSTIGETAQKPFDNLSEEYKSLYYIPGTKTFAPKPVGPIWVDYSGHLPGDPKKEATKFFAELKRYTDELGEFQGIAEKSEWTFRTPATSMVSPCPIVSDDPFYTYTHDFIGYLTTNATISVNDLPYFDEAENSLNYAVAAPHLKSDGSINSGYYQLAITPPLARCWFGKDVSNAQAKITITSENGESQVAISNIALENGMYIFKAAGFHYSNPKISIQLIKKSGTISSKITCQKGKVKKVVTGAKPTCPSGYKKV